MPPRGTYQLKGGAYRPLKLLAGRTQDLADVEAIIASGADRELLREAIARVLPEHAEILERLFRNVDRGR